VTFLDYDKTHEVLSYSRNALIST